MSTVCDDNRSPGLPTDLHHTQQSERFITATEKGDFEAHLVKSQALEVGDAPSTIKDCGKHPNNGLYHTGGVLAWACTTIQQIGKARARQEERKTKSD